MISHHHNCVFVHIPKCAGKSIEHVFLASLGLTWRTRAPLLLRPNDMPELGPPRLAHLKAADYVRCKYLTQRQFDEYFKFAFVRNPWSRVVSMYKYMGFHRHCDFATFVTTRLATELWEQRYWFVGPQNEYIYSQEGDLLVDFVGKFENIQADFNRVCRALDLPETQLRHVNWHEKREAKLPFTPKRLSTYILRHREIKRAPPHKDYKDYYDEETKGLVAELYKRDIELFGYGFDAHQTRVA
ncbi:MAG TPA: sulfotransferase family 2 domain-containing protein [Gammaproteobacteria bacterium]|nr:sulfotransferase family 2 domain-containing protein [Gammaproteobacteria bacterium]